MFIMCQASGALAHGRRLGVSLAGQSHTIQYGGLKYYLGTFLKLIHLKAHDA